MALQYDTDFCRKLEKQAEDARLCFRRKISHYDPGTILSRKITGVFPATEGDVTFEIDKFIGGGFAGQVYRVRVTALELNGPEIPGLTVGREYAVKIIIPPSKFSLLFRNAIYWLGFQAPFAAQVNEDAARSGVLWQKFFRKAARKKFGTERAVADTYATFFDPDMGSYGEINEWVEGRVWKFEIDDDFFQRKRLYKENRCPTEYLAKRRFMHQMVELCHEMGAPEFARQYEWNTCKSQPNVLKRLDAGEEPAAGLTAIDFRAGLVLLPFLPMSPADFRLIWQGFLRGTLVQFDRGDVSKLRAYCEKEDTELLTLGPALDELEKRDQAYRDAQLDLTHHGLRPVYDKKLRQSIREGQIRGWEARGITDESHTCQLRNSWLKYVCFLCISLLPILGKKMCMLWGNETFRTHTWKTLTSLSYFVRRMQASRARTLADWYRQGRVGKKKAEQFLQSSWLFWRTRIFPGFFPLPPSWFRFIIDSEYAWQRTRDAILYPIRFYRDAEFRVQWLTNEINAGQSEGMLTQEERDQILKRVSDPYIQRYLKCVGVHLCTVPVTQVMSIVVAAYVSLRFGTSWNESMKYAIGVLAAFQLLIISPGSMVRGLYVVYLIIKERNFHNYRVAVFVSFLHYIGYLGFPLQMVTEFPALARFMAGRWATRMVNFIPVFGERGALLEHWIFDLFFNIPITLRRRWIRKFGKNDDAKEDE